jgi:hypothetical protein
MRSSRAWQTRDAALDLAVRRGPPKRSLIGFSMGGAVSIGVAEHRSVTGVLGWHLVDPDASTSGTCAKRLDVVHGAWTGGAGSPGEPGSSRRAFERARALGVRGTYTSSNAPSTRRCVAPPEGSGAAAGLACLGRAGRRGPQRFAADANVAGAYGLFARSVGSDPGGLGRPGRGLLASVRPLVVVANHDSPADPFFLGTAVARPLRFVRRRRSSRRTSSVGSSTRSAGSPSAVGAVTSRPWRPRRTRSARAMRWRSSRRDGAGAPRPWHQGARGLRSRRSHHRAREDPGADARAAAGQGLRAAARRAGSPSASRSRSSPRRRRSQPRGT